MDSHISYMIMKKGVTRRFLRDSPIYGRTVTTLSNAIQNIRREIDPEYTLLSRRTKKKRFGTIHNPSPDMVMSIARKKLSGLHLEVSL